MREGTRKSGSFRSGFGEDGCFNLEETLVREEITGGFGDDVTLLEVLGQTRAAKVEVAMLETEVFVGEFFIELEGKHFCLVDNGELLGDEFNLPGGKIVVGGVYLFGFKAGGYRPGDLNHVFFTK